MNLETRYEIGQKVFFLAIDGTIQHTCISGIQIVVSNFNTDPSLCTRVHYEIMDPVDEFSKKWISEELLYISVIELAEALCNQYYTTKEGV